MWVVGVSTGTVRHIEMRELAPGDPPHRIVRRDGNLVAWGYETLVLDPKAPASSDVLAPDSWIFIPSAADDRVWVGILDPESPDTERRLQAVREMTVEGGVTVPVSETAKVERSTFSMHPGRERVKRCATPQRPSHGEAKWLRSSAHLGDGHR